MCVQQLRPLLRPSLLFNRMELEGRNSPSAGRKAAHTVQIADTRRTIDVLKEGNTGIVVPAAAGKNREMRNRNEQE